MKVISSEYTAKSKAGWVNAILIPVKQHAFCCGVLPPLVTAAFGANAGDMLHSIPGEIALGLIVPPAVTYGTMALEQMLHNRRHKSADHACDNPKTLTWQNYLRQTALSYAFYAATSLITHALFPHEHKDHDHGHPEHNHTSHKISDIQRFKI